jgi:hypothetical protein
VSEQSDRRPSDDPAPSAGHRSGRRRALVVLLTAEAMLLWIALAWQIFELISSEPAFLPSAIALMLINLLVAVWVSAIAVYSAKGRSWVRGAALSWQFVQIAISIGCFQGVYARPDVGWALLIPSIVVILLLLTPGVLGPAGSGRPARPSDG